MGCILGLRQDLLVLRAKDTVEISCQKIRILCHAQVKQGHVWVVVGLNARTSSLEPKDKDQVMMR